MDAIALRMSHVTAPAEEKVAHEVEAAKADAEKARGDREQREELDDGARARSQSCRRLTTSCALPTRLSGGREPRMTASQSTYMTRGTEPPSATARAARRGEPRYPTRLGTRLW